MSKFNHWLIFIAFAALFGVLLSGCAKDSNQDSRLNEIQEGQISNTSTSLSSEQAKIIFKDIQKLYLSTYDSAINQLDNFSIEFVNEKKEGTVTSIDANLEVDMTLIRDPKNSPLIEGMKKALSEAETDKEKEAAQQTIEGHLKEMEADYNQTVRINAPLRIELESSSKDNLKYTLYYLVENGGEVTKHPAKAYFEENFKEDRTQKQQMGYDLIKEELAQIAEEE